MNLNCCADTTHKMTPSNFLEYILFNYRWLFVCFFLLPCSFMYDLYALIKRWISFNIYLKAAPKNHEEKVKYVQKQVRDWNKSGREKPMCTARPGWKSATIAEPKYKDKYFNVEVDMSDILKVDFKKQTILVEPLVDMGQITGTLMPLGWVIPVVPELEDLTVGGLVSGQGVESTSHIYGMFQHICVSFEIVVADGSVLKCSKDENSDIFYCIPWAYGTIGFLTAIELQIMPVKKYVELTYEPVYTLDEAIRVFEEVTKNNEENLFVEGIMYSKDKGVIMSGKMTDKAENVNSIGRWYKPWFYKHVYTFLLNGKSTECIPLRDYFHRHTKPLFWEIEDIIPFGNHWLFRWLLGWSTPPKIAFLKLTQTGVIKDLYDRTHTIQDLLPPISTMREAVEYFDELFKVYPLWLCPFKLPDTPGLVHSRNGGDEMYVDIGLYGTTHSKTYDKVKTNETCVKFVKELKGYEMLYGGTFANKEEFYEMFDHTVYNKVRKELNCEDAFPEVFDKVNKTQRV